MNNNAINFEEWIKPATIKCSKIIDFNTDSDKIVNIDFTVTNKLWHEVDFTDVNAFSNAVANYIKNAQAKFAIGGYNELRTVYAISNVFNTADEPRRLHLGIDIWGDEGTKIYSPLNGIIHSYAFNNQYGDYGATIILEHIISGKKFYTLYGHLSLIDLENLQKGKQIYSGDLLAHFGKPIENGYWPPHLHFQVIIDIEDNEGDYLGVCKFSEREKYLQNCPNPDLILGLMKYAV